MRRIVLCAASVALTACAAVGSETGEAVRCQIDASPVAGGVNLEASAEAPAPVMADWQFTVDAAGGGGTSRIAQSGSGLIAPGGGNVLGTVSVGGARYDAALEVRTRGGTTTCRAASG